MLVLFSAVSGVAERVDTPLFVGGRSKAPLMCYGLAVLPRCAIVRCLPFGGTPMRQLLSGLLASLLIMMSATGSAADRSDRSYTLDHEVFAGYDIDIWNGPGAAVSIKRNGKLVFRRHDDEQVQYFFVRGDALRTSETSPLRASNILVVKEAYGSIHCCDSALIFQLAPEFRRIAEIPFAFWLRDDGGGVRPDPVEADLLVLDAGPYAGTAISARVFCEVSLRLRGTELHVDPVLQRRAPYSRRLLAFLAGKLGERRQWGEAGGGLTDQDNPSLEQFMMSLIYTGNIYQAHELMDMAWPADLPGKQEWAAKFWAERKESPYWQEISALSQRTGDDSGVTRDEDPWPICYSPVE
jgi:hypothetical protein